MANTPATEENFMFRMNFALPLGRKAVAYLEQTTGAAVTLETVNNSQLMAALRHFMPVAAFSKEQQYMILDETRKYVQRRSDQ